MGGDQQVLEAPLYGVRQMMWHTCADQRHKISPNLLRGLRVDRPNQVWCSDITYLPMRRGFLYLVMILCRQAFALQTPRGVDKHKRKVLAWRISNMLEAGSEAKAKAKAKAGIRKWINFYNRKRPHFALGRKPPAGKEMKQHNPISWRKE